MEDSSTKGLKQERKKRQRVARIKTTLICVVSIWLLASMIICTALVFKVYMLEEKLDYLLDNFTVSGQMETESKQTFAKTDESAYFDLEDTTENGEWANGYSEDYSVAEAVNQKENLAGPEDIHKVYLTFDDGPSSNTTAILDILKKHNIKATFFVIGKEDDESKARYRQIVNAGHTLAMHSYSHKYSVLYDSLDSFESDFSKIQKKNDKTTEKSDGVKANKGGIWFIMKQLGGGMLATLSIFVFTLLFSLPLGLLIAAVRMSRFALLRWIAKIYISIMRGTPLMLQLLVVFFAPYYVFGISTPYMYRLYAVIIGFSLNYAAYFAEIYRSGIQSIPQGQREAAQVMGYGRRQTFFRIIFPQMVKCVMPPVTNEVITLVKDTSLAFAIAYTEMFTMAKQIASAQASLMPLFIAGLFYYIFNFVVAFVMEAIEKKLDYYR